MAEREMKMAKKKISKDTEEENGINALPTSATGIRSLSSSDRQANEELVSNI